MNHVTGSSDVVRINFGTQSDIDQYFDLLANNFYTMFWSDVPHGHGTRPVRAANTVGWNLVSRACEICNDIGIPALIGGMRGRFWNHDVSRHLLDTGKMVETKHRWCRFGVLPYYREDDTAMTDAVYTIYHNKVLDITDSPCRCGDGTRHIRSDLNQSRGQSRPAFKQNEQMFLQMLLS